MNMAIPVALNGDALVPAQYSLLAYSLGGFVYTVKVDTVITVNSSDTMPIRPTTNQVLCSQDIAERSVIRCIVQSDLNTSSTAILQCRSNVLYHASPESCSKVRTSL